MDLLKKSDKITGTKARRRLPRLVLGLALAGLVLLSAAYVWSLPAIYGRVKAVRLTAGERYGGDKIAALMALAGDSQAPFKLRNEACWALGQLGDARALDLLKRLDTDEVQAKPWQGDKYIVQYTVEKALDQIESPFTLTRWMYARLE